MPCNWNGWLHGWDDALFPSKLLLLNFMDATTGWFQLSFAVGICRVFVRAEVSSRATTTKVKEEDTATENTGSLTPYPMLLMTMWSLTAHCKNTSNLPSFDVNFFFFCWWGNDLWVFFFSRLQNAWKNHEFNHSIFVNICEHASWVLG